MAKLTHLPSNCSTDDIIEVLERDGAAIVDGFVSQAWLNDFNTWNWKNFHIGVFQIFSHALTDSF